MPEGCIDPGQPVEREEGEPRPYRPCNGSEGEWFMGQWCARCILDAYGTDDDEDPSAPTCEILGNALAGLEPDEWIYGRDGNPRCTAFQDSPPDPFFGSPFEKDGALGLLL